MGKAVKERGSMDGIGKPLKEQARKRENGQSFEKMGMTLKVLEKH